MVRSLQTRLGVSDQNGVQLIQTAISILNYRWQNAVNPLQCSVRSLFNVFHPPTNHKAIKTLHTSFCLQTQYAEPKKNLTSVQQTLKLSFSSLGSSSPPLWNNSFTGKMVKQKKSVEGSSNDERADWKDLKELEAFCRFCAVQVMEGQRNATGFLSKIGVNEVIQQLGEMGKVVTSLQIKNKWDHLRKRWKIYNKCLDKETGLGYDPATGRFDATDEWWNRKIAACPDTKTFKTKGLPNRDLMNIMFGGTVATGKKSFCTSGPIPTETTEGSGDSDDNVEFIDPQCEPVVNVDAMEVEGPSSSRAGPAVNKGKGLATSVHIFKPISKKPKKKRSTAQEMSDSLKSISNVIVERSSLSARTPSAPTATAQVKAILDMVLSLPGVYLGHYLYMFSTIYFMEKESGRHMFEALSDNKELQLKWLEKEYQRHPDYHFE